MRAYDPGTQAWTLSYLLTDHLGSTVGITDASGTLIAEQRYLPFGEMRKDVGTIAQTDFGYTGQHDLGIGLMDYKARFYSPGLGRFLQPDTIISNPTNPQSLNRFGYVLNSPIRYNDPTGHYEDEGCGTNDPGCNDIPLPDNDDDKGDGGRDNHRNDEDKYGEDTSIAGGCSSTDYECLINKEIEDLSDPYTGIYSDPTTYYDSGAYDYDLEALYAYAVNGHDLDLIAKLRMNNPMNHEDWMRAELTPEMIDYIVQRGGSGSQNIVYNNFLKQLKLKPDNYFNYEANYLAAMMENNPKALNAAKEKTYNQVVYENHGGDLISSYMWFVVNKEAMGAPD